MALPIATALVALAVAILIGRWIYTHWKSGGHGLALTLVRLRAHLARKERNNMKRTILILIALSLSGMAQDKTLITNLTLGQFQAIVQEMGFTCTRGTQKDGKADVFFSFRAEGRKITGAINSERSDVAYLYSAFTDVTLPLDFYNDWNRENANAAYLERDNSSAISEIIVLTGGVTRENIEAHVRNFRDALIPYVRAALDRQAQEEAKGKK